MSLKGLLWGASLKLPGRENVGLGESKTGNSLPAHPRAGDQGTEMQQAELMLALAIGEEGTHGAQLGFLKATCLPDTIGIILD